MARKASLSNSIEVSVHYNSVIHARSLSEDNFAYTAREICFSLRELSLSYNISIVNIIKQSKFMLLRQLVLII